MIFFMLLSSLFISSISWAVPAPKSEQEMMKLSDLVVDAKCVQILCKGKVVNTSSYTLTTYISTLYPSKSYKGGTPKSLRIEGIEYKYKSNPPVGGWHQGPIAKGWAGKLYLKRTANGTYTKVWWNAMFTDKATSKPLPLPICQTGEVTSPDAGLPEEASTSDAAAMDIQPPDAVVKPDLNTIEPPICEFSSPDTTPMKPDTYEPVSEPSKPDTKVVTDTYTDKAMNQNPDNSVAEKNTSVEKNTSEKVLKDSLSKDTTTQSGCSCSADKEGAKSSLWILLGLGFIFGFVKLKS